MSGALKARDARCVGMFLTSIEMRHDVQDGKSLQGPFKSDRV